LLSECQALSEIRPGSPQSIKPASFQLQFHFFNRKKSQGVKSGEYGGWRMTVMLSFAINCWVRTEV
jgi:hypothetical protein